MMKFLFKLFLFYFLYSVIKKFLNYLAWRGQNKKETPRTEKQDAIEVQYEKLE